MTYLKQLALLLGCGFGGEGLSLLLGGTLPGNVLGMALLLLLLMGGVLREQQLAQTADFLLQNMAILFLPACLGVLESYSAIKSEIAAILAVCVLTTLCTAAATAFTVHLVRRLLRSKDGDAA